MQTHYFIFLMISFLNWWNYDMFDNKFICHLCFENTKITCQTFTQHGLLIERLFCWFKTNIGLHWNRRAGRLNFPSLGFIWKDQSWAQKPCFTASLWSLNCIDSPLYHISMNTHVYPYLSRKRQHHLYSKSRPNAIWPLKL